MISYTFLDSPVGRLEIAASEDAIVAINFEHSRHPTVFAPDWVEREGTVLQQAKRELREYFEGRRKTFSVRVEASGTTFQKRVWSELTRIPFGETRSYLDVATCMGKPTATRAVGAANGRNPVSIIVPCHRVIGADGSLTGFGGGIEVKKFLLTLEGVLPNGDVTEEAQLSFA
jgi:methylated-DNA-[protein]-cysteine S-methyltransferase